MIIYIHRAAIVESLPSHFSLDVKDGIKFAELIELIDKKYGGNIKDQIMDCQGLKEGVLVLVNGKHINQFGGIGIELKDGDDIFISVTIYGG